MDPLCLSQGVLAETLSVANMGVAKRGPIIEGRDKLLLEYTGGSACQSDGLQLTYTTRIHLVCSKGAVVSSAAPDNVLTIVLIKYSINQDQNAFHGLKSCLGNSASVGGSFHK